MNKTKKYRVGKVEGFFIRIQIAIIDLKFESRVLWNRFTSELRRRFIDGNG